MKLSNIYTSLRMSYDLPFFEGLEYTPGKSRKQDKYVFNFDTDSPETDIVLLKNPEEITQYELDGFPIIVSFTSRGRTEDAVRRRAEARQVTRGSREYVSQEDANALAQVVDEVNAYNAQHAKGTLTDDGDLGPSCKIGSMVADSDIFKRLISSIERMGNPTRDDISFEHLSSNDRQTLRQFRLGWLRISGSCDYHTRVADREERTAANMERYNGLEILNRTSEILTKAANDRAAALSAAQAGRGVATDQVDRAKKAFGQLGNHVITNYQEASVQRFMKLAIELIRDRITNVGVIVPVPSRDGVNQFVSLICKLISNELNGVPVASDFMKRVPFVFELDRFKQIINNYLNSPKARPNSQKYSDYQKMALIKDMRELNGDASWQSGQYVSSTPRFAGNKSIYDLFVKLTDENDPKPAGISSISEEFRRAFSGGYVTDDAAGNEVMNALSDNKQILVVDDNIYSGATMELNLSATYNFCTGLVSQLPKNFVMGYAIVSPGYSG